MVTPVSPRDRRAARHSAMGKGATVKEKEKDYLGDGGRRSKLKNINGLVKEGKEDKGGKKKMLRGRKSSVNAAPKKNLSAANAPDLSTGQVQLSKKLLKTSLWDDFGYFNRQLDANPCKTL